MVNPLKYIKTLFTKQVEGADSNISRKRKREADQSELGGHNGEFANEDDDVVITAVKRPRIGEGVRQNFSFFNNFIGNPLERMAEWVKKRSVWRPSYMQDSGHSAPPDSVEQRFKPPDPHGRNGRVQDGREYPKYQHREPPQSSLAATPRLPLGVTNQKPAPQTAHRHQAPPTSQTPANQRPASQVPPSHSANQKPALQAPPTDAANQPRVLEQEQKINSVSQSRSSSIPVQTDLSYAAVLKRAGPSMVSRAVQGRCGDGKHSLFDIKPHRKFIATECVRMEEREKYRQMLQQFTSVTLPPSPPRSVQESDRVSISSRGSSRHHESIFGDTVCRDFSVVQKKVSPQDSVPRQKVVPVNLVRSDRSLLSKRFQPEFHHATRINHQSLDSSSTKSSSKKLWSSPEHEKDVHVISEKDRTDKSENDNDIICLDDEAAEISAIPRVNGDISQYEQSSIEGRKSPFVEFQQSQYLQEDWIENIKDKYSEEARERRRIIKEEEMKAKIYEEKRKAKDENLEKRIREQMRIYDREPIVIEDLPIPEVEEEEEFPDLTEEMQLVIKDSLRPNPPDEVLVEGFKLQITRKDMSTLEGLNWLNDEIINFYMNMLMDRGEKEGRPKVHAFNTFFYPKIMNGGHSSVRRWTKRVDVFAMDYILIPVHLGMHWCLAVVDFKQKAIRYYDSMGGNNNSCLNAIKKYLCDESMDKRKQEFDLSGWKTVTAKDIPQQMNGSDCGMFACKFAEYITREAKITFSQEHMPYFRKRMVYEIVTKQLLQ